MTRRDYHTIAGWESRQQELEEYQRDKAEAEYFAHIGPATHNYPLTGKTATIVANESISKECPF